VQVEVIAADEVVELLRHLSGARYLLATDQVMNGSREVCGHEVLLAELVLRTVPAPRTWGLGAAI
jgi:hypothetical protein